jgi:hypothetical protein
MKLHLIVVEKRSHELAQRHPEPLSWKATKLTTYPSGGAGSRWSDGGTLHSGWLRLALGHRRPSRTNSSSFLSVTEERAHTSMGRIWLFPAIVVENSMWRRKGKR